MYLINYPNKYKIKCFLRSKTQHSLNQFQKLINYLFSLRLPNLTWLKNYNPLYHTLREGVHENSQYKLQLRLPCTSSVEALRHRERALLTIQGRIAVIITSHNEGTIKQGRSKRKFSRHSIPLINQAGAKFSSRPGNDGRYESISSNRPRPCRGHEKNVRLDHKKTKNACEP